MEELRQKAIEHLSKEHQYHFATKEMREYMIGIYVSAFLDGELAEITRTNAALQAALVDKNAAYVINETQKYFQ